MENASLTASLKVYCNLAYKIVAQSNVWGCVSPLLRRKFVLHVIYGYPMCSSFASVREVTSNRRRGLEQMLHRRAYVVCALQIVIMSMVLSVVSLSGIQRKSDKPQPQCWSAKRTFTDKRCKMSSVKLK